jgi:DNA mismatch repair protein MutL
VSRIRILDRSVAERIAAGEVVDRPAAAVKELIENSLDALARTITVAVEGGGLHLIRVTDDGTGIAADDVPLAFERYATSKIAQVEDLEAVRSYGFRGEALPSIAAVSRVTMTSRTVDADTATRAVLIGGTLESVTPWGAPRGTTVEVTALFFNTPARLKFLKSVLREQALVADVVQRAAMAHPEVAFRLTFDGRDAGRWPRASAEERVADLLHGGSTGDLIHLHGAIPSGALGGWVSRPERNRPNRTDQHLFVNRRPVQSALLRRAVEQGYTQLLPAGRFPVFAVFVDLDPSALDVNVHPRKMEVRFRDEGRLFGAVARIAREALLESPLVRQAIAAAGMTAGPAAGGPIAHVPAGDVGHAPVSLEVHEAARPYGADVPRGLPSLRPLGQLLNTYILAEGPDGLYLVDQHAAHERVLYERIVAGRRKGGHPSQTLVVPLTLDLTPAQMALLAGHLDVLTSLGYAVELFGARTVLLRAVPAAGAASAPDSLLQRVLGVLAEDGRADDTPERLSIATACHTAVRAGDHLSPEAIDTLLADLAATEDPFTCFHGRPTVVSVSRAQLERWFLRG